MAAAELVADDPALRALLLPFDRGDLTWPADGRVLFLGARAGAALGTYATPGLWCQQDLRPFAEQLQRAGWRVGDPAPGDQFELVMVLPPRQRDARRAQLARALGHVADAGVLLAAVANHEGARSLQADMSQLTGDVQHLSKYKCRVLWTRPAPDRLDTDMRRQWLAWDALRPTVDGMVSRPGLFAWDRIDPASALLAGYLPDHLHGHVADLGAGAGYLSVELVRRCPNVTAIDLYEADARALPAARANLETACRAAGRDVAVAVHWHDVAAGVPGAYDAIVSNPPFHQGRADLPQLGRAFIAAAAGALRPGRPLWMVANRHLAYEAALASHFARFQTHVERDGFKVIEARR